MKKISLVIFMLLAITGISRAQYTLNVSGDVNDNGVAVPFHPVILMLQSGGGIFYLDSTYTDSSGLFYFTTTISGFFSQGAAIVSTPDCQGNMISDSAGYYPGNPNLNFSLNICANAGGCNALFTAQNQGQGTFQFTNLSTGTTPMGPLFYIWDFGDGTTSTATNPTYTYNSTGTFNVCLTVIDSLGNCAATYCVNITNSGGGSNCAVTYNYQPLTQNTIAFSSTTVGTAPFAYSWSFGDGSADSAANPVHTYSNPGNYVVCLTMTDANGCSSTFCDSVVLGSGGGGGNCAANFNAINSGSTTVVFANQSSGGSPANPLSYQWTFGDGSTSTAENPVHVYNAPGTYTVCLTVSNNFLGCIDSVCQIIVVSTGGQNCSPFFYSYPTGTGTNQYQFISDSTNSPNTSYSWSFGDGTGSSATNPVHAYTGNGLYLVCLTVTDSMIGCTATFCDSVFVGNTPNCHADFSFGMTPNGAMQFVNFSSGNGPLSYIWDFGDGTTSTLQNPSHFYLSNGVYTACLTITDASGCVDSVCYQLTIQTPNPCDASWFGVNTGNQIYALCAYTYNPNYTYTWTFGDGSTGNGHSVIHTYSNTGSYVVCLTVIDSLAGCTDTFCDTLNVSSVINLCVADFVWFNTGSGVYNFVNLSIPSNPNSQLTYFWDFGDSTTSTQQNPMHTFAGPGPYNVCLTILDSLTGCTATSCHVVGGPNAGYNISGAVFADSNNLIYNGVVYLIQHDSTAGTLTAIDSTYIGQSYYNFSSVSPGTYLIKAALLPSAPDYANYLPTYLGDQLFWYNATSTVVTNTNILNPPILMVQGTNPGGPGFVGGLISQGANKGPGDPMQDVSVLMVNMDESGVTHTTTDATGHYSFDDLAYGTYKVYVEILGKYSDPWIVTIDATDPEFHAADFEVGKTQITAVGTTSIDQFTFGKVLGIYPNPASSTVNVGVEFTEPADLQITLINLMGQTVHHLPAGWVAGQREFSLDIGNLPQGTYLLRLQADNQVISRRIIKQ